MFGIHDAHAYPDIYATIIIPSMQKYHNGETLFDDIDVDDSMTNRTTMRMNDENFMSQTTFSVILGK